jgi:LytTr DNA-binding domain-containing protein
MRALIERPMSPRVAWVTGVILLSSGGIYCLVYSLLSQRPEGLGIALSWALVSLLPWLVAFEIGKRVNCDPTGTWKAHWWRIAAILGATALVSVAMQNWLWADGQLSMQEAAVAILRRIPPALLISFLLFLVPMLQQRAETEHPIQRANDDLPLLPQQIDWIRASGNYLEIKAGERLILHRMTMSTAEQLLKHHEFVRIHRSALINTRCVKKHDRGKIADELVLQDGTRLKVGGSYRAFIDEVFGDGAHHRECRQ